MPTIRYNPFMPIKRYYIPGSAVFITQVVQFRVPLFNNPRAITLLRETLHNVQLIHPFRMLAYVFLPDHFHMIIQPTEKSNFSEIMHSLKPNFTKKYKELVGELPSDTIKIWQRRFWDHIIRDDRDFENHLHYIHYNPVKHGYVTAPEDWPDSSYFEWTKRGLYSTSFLWNEPKDYHWGE